MKLIKSLILSIVLAGSLSAQAGILLEPHFGLNLSGDGRTGGTEYSYGGVQYGMRAGYQMLGFMGGIDYRLSSYTWTRRISTSKYDDKFDRTEIGLFGGYQFPILVRAWAAYYFNNSAKDQESSGLTASGVKYEGSTLEFGAGYTGLPFLSVNLAYRMISIDKLISASGTETTLTGADEILNHEVVLGISAPFNLF